MNFEEQTKVEQIQNLIDTALSNKHAKVERINNINEYLAAKTLVKGLRRLIIFFMTSANDTYKEYINDLKNRIDNVQLLFNYRILKRCEKYYCEEYINNWVAIEEYRNYLSSNNFFKSFFGYDRRNDDDNE